MSNFQTVIYSVENRVATIRMNRPGVMNAVNEQMRNDLLAAVDMANADDQVRVIVLGGKGRGFCAGADLTEDYRPRYDSVDQQIKKSYKPVLMTLYDSDKITLSSVRGAAAGAGSALAMVCDLSIMADDAYIYQAFAAIALVPDCGASWHLVRQLGRKRAFQVMLEAEKLAATECVELGLANRVVAVDDLDGATQAWAEKLAACAPLAQRHLKQLVRQAPFNTLEQSIDQEAGLQNDCIASADFAEGTAAFFEKREAFFSGR
jgi:2-(1,2-epoxy-1,2-dihydrophenyl)acetyl-CoA isomerase